ncbi:hypothetical protein EON62_01660 [archaeon]|nr:MAG: hypothetical protein EON62_01660 [archaeon]
MPTFSTSTVQTVAGSGGVSGFSGDEAPATSATLSAPTAVASYLEVGTSAAHLWILDAGNARVRHVDVAGVIHTVAGNGQTTHSGDGGDAKSAGLEDAAGIAVVYNASAAQFVLWIVERSQHCVRFVDVDGVISTVIGTPGTASFAGDGALASAAHLSMPHGVHAVYNASSARALVWVADTGNNRVRHVNEAGVIATVAGDGTPAFAGDAGAATAASLDAPSAVQALVDFTAGSVTVYIMDTGNRRVRRIASDNTIGTVLGSGAFGRVVDGSPATALPLDSLDGMAMVENPSVPSVNMFITETVGQRVLHGTLSGNVFTLAGPSVESGVTATMTTLLPTGSVAVLANAQQAIECGLVDSYWFADTGNHVVRQVDATGNMVTIAGNGVAGFSGDGSTAVDAKLDSPSAVAVSLSSICTGEVWIADTGNHRIRFVNKGGMISTIAGTGAPTFAGDGGPAVSAKLHSPAGIFLLQDTPSLDVQLWIADTGNHAIRYVDVGGDIHTVAGIGGSEGAGVDSQPATAVLLHSPRGVSAIRSTEGVRVFIADTENHLIRMIQEDGTLYNVAGTGSNGTYDDSTTLATSAALNRPTAVAARSEGSNYYSLWIADTGNHVVRFVDSSGSLSRYAGDDTGASGFAGDGGSPTQSMLSSPGGIALDYDATSVFITDTMNYRVRKVGAQAFTISSLQRNTGGGAYLGDEQTPASTRLSLPAGVCAYQDPQTSAYSLLVADTANHVVRITSADGSGSVTAIAARAYS